MLSNNKGNNKENNDDHFENIDYYYHNNSSHFQSPDNLNSDSDSKTIIEFDDEYSEDSNLYSNSQSLNENKKLKKKQKKENNEDENEENENEENENEEEEQSSEVTDPNVQQLMNMNMEDKEAVLNFLMKDNILSKKKMKSEEIIKEKNRNKYGYIESKLLNDNKKNSYGREGFQINPQEGDPQFVKDMNIAAFLLKDQIKEENKDVAKLLLDDINLNCTNKKITAKQIGEKIKSTLRKKRKNLEKIEAKITEEEKISNTFSPSINHHISDTKRSFNKFLKDQDNYSKRVRDKKEALMKITLKEKEPIGIPQLNKTSEKIAKKLYKNEEPAYLRLYKNNHKIKTFEEEKLNKQKEKEENLKKKEKNDKKNPYSYIESKIDMGKKKHKSIYKNSHNSELNITNKIKVPENRKAKSQEKQYKTFDYFLHNKKLLDLKDIPSSKILYDNFEKKFDDIIQNNSDKNELDETNFQKLLYELGMSSYLPNLNENNNNEKNAENTPEILLENSLRQNENKIITDVFNLLKNDENKVKTTDAKKFLNCIVGNQNYALYNNYKIKHANELKNLFPNKKFKKEDIPDLMIKNENQELKSEIDHSNPKNNKYIFHSNDKQIIIPLENGNLIKKDFHILGLNYRNNKKKSKDNFKFVKKYPFKPTINPNSEKLSQKMKEKSMLAIQSLQNNKNLSTPQLNTNPHMEYMDYIDRILLLDKKRIAENKKIKEELEKKEIKECTFRPKINKNFIFTKEEFKELNRSSKSTTNIIKQKNNNNNIKKPDKKKEKYILSNRLEKIYQKGKEKLRDKKNRTKEEIEEESQKKECTFQPDIKKNNISEAHFNNDIYNEKEYQDLYERLKRGRMEKMVKNSINDRYGLNPELQQYIKDTKEYIKGQFFEENYVDYEDMGVNDSNQNLNKEISENDPEKKEGIPLLIIDVNIRQGVKKKIYVYEGDTPEILAEKFAKENQLEPETQNKLQNLIHTHMLKLLTRIEEENQSVSEKSQTPNKKNNNNNQKLEGVDN